MDRRINLHDCSRLHEWDQSVVTRTEYAVQIFRVAGTFSSGEEPSVWERGGKSVVVGKYAKTSLSGGNNESPSPANPFKTAPEHSEVDAWSDRVAFVSGIKSSVSSSCVTP